MGRLLPARQGPLVGQAPGFSLWLEVVVVVLRALLIVASTAGCCQAGAPVTGVRLLHSLVDNDTLPFAVLAFLTNVCLPV